MSVHEPTSYKTKRDTARGIILHNGSVLLIKRSRLGLNYYSTPGGGIEPGETPFEAVKRELHEETSLELNVEREIYQWHEGPHIHYFFYCTYVSGVPHLQEDAEENQNGPDNTHTPIWIDANEIIMCNFGYWEPLKNILANDIKNGLPEISKIITTSAVV